MREVWVTGAGRTAVGGFGGGLKDVAPCDLGATVVKAVLERAGVDGSQVGHLAFGHVVPTEARDMYVSRLVAVNGGLPIESAAFNVNRLCGSGLQAIVSASQSILLGDTEMAIGGGVEVMSRGGYLSQTQRWGARMGDSTTVDMMVGALTDPFGRMHMGVTAENVAAQFGISRADQDALAVESHRRAVHAQDEGRFNDQIIPVVIGDNARTMRIASTLQADGFDIRGIRPPTVAQGTARLRIAITLHIGEHEIDAMTEGLAAAMAAA